MTTGRINQVTFFVYRAQLNTKRETQEAERNAPNSNTTPRSGARCTDPVNQQPPLPRGVATTAGRPVNSWRINQVCCCVRQRLFDSLVTFHYAYHHTKLQREEVHAASWRQTFDASNSPTPKLNLKGAKCQRAFLQTSIAYDYPTGIHTNSSTRYYSRQPKGSITAVENSLLRDRH